MWGNLKEVAQGPLAPSSWSSIKRPRLWPSWPHSTPRLDLPTQPLHPGTPVPPHWGNMVRGHPTETILQNFTFTQECSRMFSKGPPVGNAQSPLYWLFLNFFLKKSFHHTDMKNHPESSVHTPFTKRHPYQAATSTSSMLDVFLQDKGLPPSSSSSLPQQITSSPHVVPPPASSLPKMAAVTSLGQQVSPGSSDCQSSSPLPMQQHKNKQQKKRTSITTKVTAPAAFQPFCNEGLVTCFNICSNTHSCLRECQYTHVI